jgi:Fur family ferric uptake transcriptional regulator
MENELALLRRHIKDRGLRDTAQREDVLRFLFSRADHLSSEEVYQGLRGRRANVGRATVYRTLKLLAECGLATKVTFPDGTVKFERAHGRAHHDHMICVECGTALEFESPAIERLQAREARRLGFEIRWHRHELFGRCRSCARGRR